MESNEPNDSVTHGHNWSYLIVLGNAEKIIVYFIVIKGVHLLFDDVR
jgi:hypothetical protein